MRQITPSELWQWIKEKRPFTLLDVREEEERLLDHIGGEWMPMDEVLKRHAELPSHHPLVLYCRKGVRSAIVIQRLQDKYNMNNLYNLAGGITQIRALGLPL